VDQNKIFASVLKATEHEIDSVDERAWIMGFPNLRSHFINIEVEIERRYPTTVMDPLQGENPLSSILVS
jgi:hypothetical protein